jgi:hypothetical protein
MSLEGAMRHKKKIAAAAGLALGIGAHEVGTSRPAGPSDSEIASETTVPSRSARRSERRRLPQATLEAAPAEISEPVEEAAEPGREDALPEFTDMHLGSEQLMDFPERDVVYEVEFGIGAMRGRHPSADKRIVDAMIADRSFARLYEQAVDNLQWEIDRDFVRVTLPPDLGDLDMSFQMEPRLDASGNPMNGWQVAEYNHDNENGLVLTASDDPENAVLIRVKVNLEAVVKRQLEQP